MKPEATQLTLSESERVVVDAMRRGDEYIHRIDFDKALDEIKRLRTLLRENGIDDGYA